MIKKTIIIALTIMVSLLFTGCDKSVKELLIDYENATVIELKGDSAKTITNDEDGQELIQIVPEYDYTWHVDLTSVHDEVKNAPAEYYTGTLPKDAGDIYIDHDLPFYPELDKDKFTKVNYDGEQEWVYYYEDGENDKYIFSTLPGSKEPNTEMMHSEEEAAKNKVLHITKEGTYVLKGNFDGQVLVDLGEDAFTDESKVVTLVLAGVDINCTAAPGVVFENVYECDNTWEDKEENTNDVDTTNAGARVVIADGTKNVISGCNIYRMLKTKYKDEDSTDKIKVQKKMRKIDAALYSYMSMNIYGEKEESGTLEVNSSFEGIDSELHLTFESGNITINSQDDGINTNEDNVSITIFNGGTITVNCALGDEGDGVDSNGFVVVNGGIINLNNIRGADNGIDSEDGIVYNGGQISINGEIQELEPGTETHEIGGRQMGRFGGGKRPEDFDPANMPEDFDPENMPKGRHEMLEDFDQENMPKGRHEMPEDFDPENMPEGFDKERNPKPNEDRSENSKESK